MSTQPQLQIVVDASELFGDARTIGKDMSSFANDPHETFKAFANHDPHPDYFDHVIGRLDNEQLIDLQFMFDWRLHAPRLYAGNEYARAVLAIASDLVNTQVTLIAPTLPQRIATVAAKAVTAYSEVPVLGIGYVTTQQKEQGSKMQPGYDPEKVAEFSKRNNAKLVFVGRVASKEALEQEPATAQAKSDVVLTAHSDAAIAGFAPVLSTYSDTVSHIFWRMNGRPHGSRWVRKTAKTDYEYYEKSYEKLPVKAVLAALQEVRR
jgi:hypothetical protein